jgi:hypothetical protein
MKPSYKGLKYEAGDSFPYFETKKPQCFLLLTKKVFSSKCKDCKERFVCGHGN